MFSGPDATAESTTAPVAALPRAAGVRLTRREREVMVWAAAGKSGASTGIILGISEHTVSFHRKRALAKLGVASLIQGVAECIRRGLIG